MHIIFLLVFPLLLLSNDKIQKLFNSNNYTEACEISDKFYNENPYNFKANLYYAKCAQFRGEIDKAIAAYDRADILKEDDVDLHKYLGDLHVQIGNIQIANSEYDKADRFSNSPVKRTLSKDYSPHNFSTLFSISSGYDTNVNYSAELSDMGNWLGELPSSVDKPASDTFVKEYLRLSHVYDADPYSTFYYKTQFNVYNKNYIELSDEDFFQSKISSGIGWASNDFDIWLPLTYTYLATSYDSYANLYAFNPKFRVRLQNKILFSLNSMYEMQEYRQWSGSDKSTFSTDVGISRWFGDNYFKLSYFYLNASKQDSDSNNVFIDKTSNELQINYTRKLIYNLEFGIAYSYNKTLYKDSIKQDSLEKREDDLSLSSAYLSYNLSKSLIFISKYDKYQNMTNYTPSLYDKQIISIGVYYYY